MLHEPLQSLIIYYVLYSLYGWICETVYCSALEKHYVRRGFLRGPYCPVYGAGALVILALCLPCRDTPLLVFVVALVAASVVEYATGWLFESALGLRLWDYSGHRLHIRGRVCLLNSILFGILGLAAVYLVHPPTARLVALASPELQRIIALSLMLIMGLDFFDSLRTVAGLSEKLDAIHAQLDVMRRQREAAPWLDAANLPESLRRLRDRTDPENSPLTSILERLDMLVAQQDAARRLVENYPTLTAKDFGPELAVLRDSWRQDRKALVQWVREVASHVRRGVLRRHGSKRKAS